MEKYRHKIGSLREIEVKISRVKSEGKKVIFTNGCFDILHPGHTRYLYAARAFGDYLVVGLNSDRSVRAIKGPGRPVLPEEVRAELVAALGFVNKVLIFDEETPLEVIQALLPDFLVKGGDWAEEDIVGAEVVRKAGGEVKTIPYVQGFSTSALIKRIRNSLR